MHAARGGGARRASRAITTKKAADITDAPSASTAA
jgi:hypothetical protein